MLANGAAGTPGHSLLGAAFSTSKVERADAVCGCLPTLYLCSLSVLAGSPPAWCLLRASITSSVRDIGSSSSMIGLLALS